MAKEDKTDGLSFWEHLDVLRTAIVKIVAVAVRVRYRRLLF